MINTLGSIIPKVSKPAHKCIKLTQDEQKIFTLLRECCEHFQLNVVLRVAGGWVRDKLLSIESKDCDIAIDKMMGREFADHFKNYLSEHKVHSSSFGVIQANPEKSKHLETATLTVYDYPLDFVNLRSESYTDDSRIPNVTFGDPLEDSLRRDITINSLFYNIQANLIEDFCGHGLQDLSDGLIRTPLPAKETLLDDPLRLLRVIRFATRFNFRIDADLQAAIIDESVDAAFKAKISRERVGIEIDKILRDRRALHGIRMIASLGNRVFDLIFQVPFQDKTLQLSHDDVKSLMDLIEYCHSSFHDYYDNEADLKRLFLLATCLIPHFSNHHVHRGKTEYIPVYIIRESLKFSSNDMNNIELIVSNIIAIHKVLNTDKDLGKRKILAGKLVDRLGKIWITAFHISIVYELFTTRKKKDEGCKVVENYKNLIKSIHEWNLDQIYTKPKLINGNEIAQEFGVKGKDIGKYLNIAREWQYANIDERFDSLLEYLKNQEIQ